MKKILFIALMMVISMSATTVLAANANPKNPTEKPAVPAKTENKLNDEQVNRLKSRVKEIRDMDKSEMSSSEKLALRKEVKEIKQTVKREGGYIYVGGATVVLLIILLIILI